MVDTITNALQNHIFENQSHVHLKKDCYIFNKN